MVKKLQDALLKNPTAASFTVDGVTTTFVETQQRLQQCQANVARENKTRSRFSSPTLGGFVS